MSYFDGYPNLKRAALEIAYDNGMVNRDQTEEEYLAACEPIFQFYNPEDLRRWDSWVGTLKDEELQIITCGEQLEMEAVMQDAPEPISSTKTLGDLLNEFFES